MRHFSLIFIIFWLITGFFLQGCSMHQIRPAQMHQELPESYDTQNIQKDAFSNEKWWLVFRDETLNTLMGKTFEGNLDIAQYIARLQQATATGRQRKADKLPYINLESSVSQAQQVSAAGETTGNAYSYSIAAGYEVDLWNKLASQAHAQNLETAASRLDLHALYLSLSAQVAENYYIMVEQRAKLALISQTIDARRDNLELVEMRYKEGMVSALDLYQARQNLANAMAQEPNDAVEKPFFKLVFIPAH